MPPKHKTPGRDQEIQRSPIIIAHALGEVTANAEIVAEHGTRNLDIRAQTRTLVTFIWAPGFVPRALLAYCLS